MIYFVLLDVPALEEQMNDISLFTVGTAHDKSPNKVIPYVTSNLNTFEKFDLDLWKNWEIFRGLIQQNK